MSRVRWPSLRAQDDGRIDAGRTARRQPTAREDGRREHEAGEDERDGAGPIDAVDGESNQASRPHRDHGTAAKTRQHKDRTLPKHETDDSRRRVAERDSDPELARALADRLR